MANKIGLMILDFCEAGHRIPNEEDPRAEEEDFLVEAEDGDLQIYRISAFKEEDQTCQTEVHHQDQICTPKAGDLHLPTCREEVQWVEARQWVEAFQGEDRQFQCVAPQVDEA